MQHDWLVRDMHHDWLVGDMHHDGILRVSIRPQQFRRLYPYTLHPHAPSSVMNVVLPMLHTSVAMCAPLATVA